MDFKEFTVNVLRTAVTPAYDTPIDLRDLQTRLCLVDLSCDLVDFHKKHIFTGKPIDQFKFTVLEGSMSNILSLNRIPGTCFPQISRVDLGVVHAIVGIVTESGELVKALLKAFPCGLTDDIKLNIKEELGDLMFYVAYLCSRLGLDFEEVLDKNTAKLKVRYGDKFDQAKSLHRDLQAEKEALI